MGLFKKKQRGDAEHILARPLSGTLSGSHSMDSAEENEATSSNANRRSKSKVFKRFNAAPKKFQLLGMSRSDDSKASIYERTAIKRDKHEIRRAGKKEGTSKANNNRIAIKIKPKKKFQRLDNFESIEEEPEYVPPAYLMKDRNASTKLEKTEEKKANSTRGFQHFDDKNNNKTASPVERPEYEPPPPIDFFSKADAEYEPPSDFIPKGKKSKSKEFPEYEPPSDFSPKKEKKAEEFNDYTPPPNFLKDKNMGLSLFSEVSKKGDDTPDNHFDCDSSNEFRQFVFDKDFQTIEKVVVERSDSGTGDADIFRMAAVETVKQYSLKKNSAKGKSSSHDDFVDEFIKDSHRGTSRESKEKKVFRSGSGEMRKSEVTESASCSDHSSTFSMTAVITSNPFVVDHQWPLRKPTFASPGEDSPSPKASYKLKNGPSDKHKDELLTTAQKEVSSNRKPTADRKSSISTQRSHSPQRHDDGSKRDKAPVSDQFSWSTFPQTEHVHQKASSPPRTSISTQQSHSPQRGSIENKHNKAPASDDFLWNSFCQTKQVQTSSSPPRTRSPQLQNGCKLETREAPEDTMHLGMRQQFGNAHDESNQNEKAQHARSGPSGQTGKHHQPQKTTMSTDLSLVSTVSNANVTVVGTLKHPARHTFEEERNDEDDGQDDPFKIGKDVIVDDSAWDVDNVPFQTRDDALIISIRKAASKEPRDPETRTCKPDPSPRGPPMRSSVRERSEVPAKGRSTIIMKRRDLDIIESESLPNKISSPFPNTHPKSSAKAPVGLSGNVTEEKQGYLKEVPTKSTAKPPTGVPENAILASMLFRQTQAGMDSEASLASKHCEHSQQPTEMENDLRRLEVPPSIHAGTAAESVVSSVTQEASTFYQKNFSSWKTQAHSVLNNYNKLKQNNPGAYRSSETQEKATGNVTWMNRVEDEHLRLFSG